MKKWARAMYQPNLPLKGERRVTASKAHIDLSLTAACEGMVLLKNENNILPLKKGSRLALFGKGAYDYVKGGGGSGDVFTKPLTDLPAGLKETGAKLFEPLMDFYKADLDKQYKEGSAPGMTIEPKISDKQVTDARSFTDTAIIGISRFSGEGWDRSDYEFKDDFNPWESEVTMPKLSAKIFPKGDFYLTAEEEATVKKVLKHFDKVIVVLNVGGMVALDWIKDNKKIDGALLSWQGGIRGGLAAARLLFGLDDPSGRLPDTFADTLEAYPSTEHFHDSPLYVEYNDDIYVGYRYFETIPGAKEHVVYPFGYGLSYTKFKKSVESFSMRGGKFTVKIKVKNTGKVKGKDVAILYVKAPQGKLGKAARSMVAFNKTKLLSPGEEEVLTLSFDRYTFASFDDKGDVCKSAYVLEKGEYEFYLGGSVEEAVKIKDGVKYERDLVIDKLESHLSPVSLTKRLKADGSYEKVKTGKARDINESIIKKLPADKIEALIPEVRGRAAYMMIHPWKNDAHPLMDVAEGKITLDEFIAQLDDADLMNLLGGQPNTGVGNTWGFGGLSEYGVPTLMTADGPAGVRLNPDTGVLTTAWPCATLLASTFNTKIARKVGAAGGAELKENNLYIWLAPGVNIHRSPLCGRNFEYYSEDPLLAGKIGSAFVNGIQSNNVGASVKHFAANNKETNRKHCDSRVSERALREIYLKVFEIIVKEASPYTIMSSYNAINGVRTAENKELLTDVLRGEWGFKGLVTTDWWGRSEHYKEVLAGNDIKMANGFPDRLKLAMDKGALTRKDLETCARRILELILKVD